MTLEVQTIVVLLSVAGAGAYLIRRGVALASGGGKVSGCGGGSCGGCGSTGGNGAAQASPLVALDAGPHENDRPR